MRRLGPLCLCGLRGAIRIMGFWVAFLAVCLDLIKVLRLWSQVQACGEFALYLRSWSPSFGWVCGPA